MKTRTTQRRPFGAILALVASLFVALLITAPGVQANTGAGATILNTVQVDYTDASGTTLQCQRHDIYHRQPGEGGSYPRSAGRHQALPAKPLLARQIRPSIPAPRHRT